MSAKIKIVHRESLIAIFSEQQITKGADQTG